MLNASTHTPVCACEASWMMLLLALDVLMTTVVCFYELVDAIK